MTRRIIPIMKKEAIHIWRDPRSLYMALGLPMVLLILFGYAITMDVRHVEVGIIDQDGTALSRNFISRVRASDYFSLRYLSSNDTEIERLLNEGFVKVFIVIPPDFSRDLAKGKDKALQLLVDGSNNNRALVSLGYVSRIIQIFATDVLTEKMSRQGGLYGGGFPMIDPRIRVWYNPELRSANFIVPGLIAVVMTVMTTLLTSLTVAREWENGTMEQLIAGPARSHEIVIGKMLPYFLLGLAQVALVVLAGTLIFKVPLKGNLFVLFVVSAIFLFCGLGIGLLLSIVTRSQQLAYMFSILTTLLPSYLLSGFIFPIKSMPKVIQWISALVPARYFLTTLRGIFLKGYGFGSIWLEISALSVLSVIIFLTCIKRMKLSLE
ncbi:MAG: ABC transporter permease [Candidatus Aminicenantes bacterium]|nr:ABC transporter permease [Candidatus Aminicenantes bacterium]